MISAHRLILYGLYLTVLLIVVSAGSTGRDAQATPLYKEATANSSHSRDKDAGKGESPRSGALANALPEPQAPSMPMIPAVVLYDQYNNTSGTVFESTYHTDSEAHRDYMADDFVVPPGYTWSINEVNAVGDVFGSEAPSGFNVALYLDEGTLPGALVYTTTNTAYTVGDTYYYTITIPSAIVGPGTYWLMLQANGTVDSAWYWAGRDVQAFNSAAWKQPGNAYGRNCFDWTRKPICFDDVPNDPDQLYRLVGTMMTTPTPSETPTRTVTSSPTLAPTISATATQTTVPPTPTSTHSATATSTVSVTPTVCPVEFSDVPPSNTFYISIRCLVCRGIVSGYSDGTFRPNNQVTRGQLAKMVSNSAGFSDPVSGQTFEDVPPTNTFYEWIERLTTRGYMTGYLCGGPGEPCTSGRPYFRPFANATRGQTAKIVSNAAGFTEPPVGQTFQDVPSTSTFYEFIQRLASRNVMQGYTCGGPGEPCVGPENKPYFRPNNDVTRGQSAKIVANTFYPDCETPARR